MSEDDMGKAFDELVEQMSSPDAPQQIEVVEVAERASMVEFVVPLANYSDPEVALFRVMTEYLASSTRRHIAGISITYEIRSHNQPFLIASLMLGEPLT